MAMGNVKNLLRWWNLEPRHTSGAIAFPNRIKAIAFISSAEWMLPMIEVFRVIVQGKELADISWLRKRIEMSTRLRFELTTIIATAFHSRAWQGIRHCKCYLKNATLTTICKFTFYYLDGLGMVSPDENGAKVSLSLATYPRHEHGAWFSFYLVVILCWYYMISLAK